jgi:hypothetical protein
MSKPAPIACPKCHGQVSINPSSGGRGTNDLTSYRADCETCGMLLDHLSDTGRRDSAVRDYNRWARAYVAPTAASSITVRSGFGAFDGGAKPDSRPAPISKTKNDAMKKTNETIGQAWMRELSLITIDKTNTGAFEDAQKAVLALNPALGMDSKALYFAAQGWMVAQPPVVVGASRKSA